MAWLKNNAYRLGLLLIIVVAGIFLAYIDQNTQSLQQAPLPQSAEGTPDQYLENAQLTRYDADGQPYQRMESPRVSHYASNGSSQAEQPRIQVIDSSNRTWHISGDTGQLDNSGNNITLTGHALAVQPDNQWRMTSDIVHYNRDQGRVWSNTESFFHQGQQETQGSAFQAWINRNHMVLQGNVSSSFNPQRH